MKKCTECGAEQESGKFCGQCGGPLVEVASDLPLTNQKENEVHTESEHTQVDDTGKEATENPTFEGEEEEAATTFSEGPIHANQPKDKSDVSLDRFKDESREYWSYFTYYLKRPSHIFSHHVEEFKNGMINLVVMLVTLALSTYFLFRNIIIASGMGYIDSVPFFPIFGNVLLYTALFVALVVAILYVITKLFGPDYSFKSMLTIYNGHLSFLAILSVAALLLLLIKANLIGMVLITLVAGFAMTSMPIYIISSLLTRKSKAIDPFYGYLIYVVAIGLGGIIIFSILADSAIGGFIDELQYMFY